MTDAAEYDLTTRDVAEILGCHLDTVARWADLGRLPYWRSGIARAPRRFRRADVDAFAAKQRVGALVVTDQDAAT